MEKDLILVSIAMITYKQSKYLRQAIDSVLSQNVDFKYEIIVGDDCSPDNTKEILEDYKQKYPNIFQILNHPKNIGPTNNFYEVLSKCKGKYIAGLEGDDYWLDANKLKKQVRFLEKNHEFGGIASFTRRVNENEELLNIFPKKENIKDNEIFNIYNITNYLNLKNKNDDFHLSTMMYRNIFIHNSNIKNLITSPNFVGDVQVKMLVLNMGKIRIMDEETLCYRFIDNESTSFSAQSFVTRYSDIKLAFNIMDKYFDLKYHDMIKMYLVKDLYSGLFDILKFKNFKLAYKLYKNELNAYCKIKFISYCLKRIGNKIFHLKIEENVSI